MDHLASAPGFANATMADVILADSRLGMLVHHAVKRRRMFYDGHTWTYRHGYGKSEPQDEVVVWARHWLTQGVVELEEDFRPVPGTDPREFVLEIVLPMALVFTDQWGDPVYAHDRNLWNCNCTRTERQAR